MYKPGMVSIGFINKLSQLYFLYGIMDGIAMGTVYSGVVSNMVFFPYRRGHWLIPITTGSWVGFLTLLNSCGRIGWGFISDKIGRMPSIITIYTDLCLAMFCPA
jgi:hypothetical protein